MASLVGGPNDKSLDAIQIDDAARKVFLDPREVSSKRSGGGAEKRSDILAFARSSHAVSPTTSRFRNYSNGLAAAVAGKAIEARKRIKSHGYHLQLYFVTTGKCSAALLKRRPRASYAILTAHANIDIIDGRRVLRLLFRLP